MKYELVCENCAERFEPINKLEVPMNTCPYCRGKLIEVVKNDKE